MLASTNLVYHIFIVFSQHNLMQRIGGLKDQFLSVQIEEICLRVQRMSIPSLSKYCIRHTVRPLATQRLARSADFGCTQQTDATSWPSPRTALATFVEGSL